MMSVVVIVVTVLILMKFAYALAQSEEAFGAKGSGKRLLIVERNYN